MMSPTSEVKPSQVAQLMKENAKLKEKLAEHEESWWLLWSDADDDYKAVLAENKKLKAENEKLQNDFQKGYDEGLEEHVVDKEYLDEKEEEIDKLKEENKKLKETCGEWRDKCGSWREKFMILQASAVKHLGTGFNDYKQ